MTNKTEGIRKQASELIEQAYQRGYKVGYEAAKENIKSGTESRVAELMEIGRNEAWEAAKKILIPPCDGGLATVELKKIFGESGAYIFNNFTVSEAIARIKAYEARKHQKEDSEIRVGDEVTDGNGIKGVVVGAFRNSFGVEYISVLGTGEDFEVPQVMPRENYKKSGRHFHEIAEVLKKLQEGKECS